MTLTAVSLFGGVGGIDLALQRAGIHTTTAVEIDNAARGVLADQFPHTTLRTDVTEVTANDLRADGFVPARGILAAGWPCQGNSVAGHRGGMADPRSGLWQHVVRLLAEARPRWFVGENVPGLLTVNGGRDIAIVRRDLAQLGYWWAERILDAQYFGVPQRRRRVVFVAHLADARRPVQVLFERDGSGRDSAACDKARQATPADLAPGVGGSKRVVINALTASQGGADDNDAQAGQLVVSVGGTIAHTLTKDGHDASEDGTGRGTPIITTALATKAGATYDDQQTGQLIPTEIKSRRLTPLECERLQGFPDNWTATSNGKPQADSPRYQQMGNAVAVPVFEWVTRRLVDSEGCRR